MLQKRNFYLFNISIILLLWYLTVFIIYPLVSTIFGSFEIDGQFSLQYYKDLLTNKNRREIITNTLLLIIMTIPLCALIGISTALCIHAVKVPFKKIWHICMLLPMVIPGTVVVIAYINLYGNRGLLGWPLREALGLEFGAYPITGLGGILFVHMFTQYIYFYLLTSEAIERIDVSQIEAAQSLGAKPTQIFWQVVFPSFTPALTSAAVLTLLSAKASFSAPLLLGGTFRVLSTEIYYSAQRGESKLGMAQAIVFSLLILMILWVVRVIEGHIFKGTNNKGSNQPFQPLDNPILVNTALGYLSVITLIILLPIFAIIIISFGKIGTWEKAFHSTYTFDNYQFVLTNINNFKPIINSLLMAFIGTSGALIIGVFIAYIVTRTKFKYRIVIESISLLPWLLPTSALLIALVTSYNVKNPLIFNQVLTGSYMMLPLAFIILRLSIMVRSASASLITMPSSLEEASRSLGADGLTTFRCVVLPYIIRGLSFSTTITFIYLMGEYSAPAFTAVPANIPIVMVMLGNIISHRIEVAMVYGVILLGIIFVLMLIFNSFYSDDIKKLNK